MCLMVRLYIILMPRSLCVCVRLGVTFTLIFIINYYYEGRYCQSYEGIGKHRYVMQRISNVEEIQTFKKMYVCMGV